MPVLQGEGVDACRQLDFRLSLEAGVLSQMKRVRQIVPDEQKLCTGARIEDPVNICPNWVIPQLRIVIHRPTYIPRAQIKYTTTVTTRHIDRAT